MSKRDDAISVLPKLLEMIISDLQKADHYLEKSIAVAIVAEREITPLRLADAKKNLSLIIELLQEESEEL